MRKELKKQKILHRKPVTNPTEANKEKIQEMKRQQQLKAELEIAFKTGDTEKIAELLHDSPEEALRKAHSLKGVGGNLGAKKLREAAGNVEQALKDGSGSVTELLAELKIRLDKAIDEAQEFLDQQQNGG